MNGPWLLAASARETVRLWRLIGCFWATTRLHR
jgi:hypothetical protein